MINKGSGLIGLCFIWVAMLSGCAKDKAQTSTCTTCPATSFKADIIPIFNTNCATTTSCHHGSNAVSGHLDLDSTVAYAQATQAGTGYVKPNDANNSILYDQLFAGVGQHMPIGGQLDQCTMQKIYCWIQEGAPNN